MTLPASAPTISQTILETGAAIKADLYIDRIDFKRYLNQKDCAQCGCTTCGEWLDKLKTGVLRPEDCPPLGDNSAWSFSVALSMENVLPDVEVSQHPVRGIEGYFEVNGPGPEDPVLVTGNALSTQEVVLAVLSTTTAPFHLLFTDTLGHTMDMAMVYEAFDAKRIKKVIDEAQLSEVISHRELVLPGVSEPLKDDLGGLAPWTVRFGPHCAGELPLFFAERWTKP